MDLDYALEQFAVPVAKSGTDLIKIKEMKSSGIIRFSLYFYIDKNGACRMLDDDTAFGNKVYGFDLMEQRRYAMDGLRGRYVTYSHPSEFKPPLVVYIHQYFHSCGLIFLHESTKPEKEFQ